MTIAAVGYAAWWHWVADRVTAEVDAWRTDQAEKGVRVETGDISIRGFPGIIHVRIDEAAIGAYTGAWAVRVPRIEARISPWRIDAVEGDFYGRMFAAVAFETHSATYEIDLDDGAFAVMASAVPTVDVTVDGLHVRRTDSETNVVVDALAMTVTPVPEDQSLRLIADLDTLSVAERPLSPLGDTLERLQTTIDLIGPIPHEGASRDRLRAWSEAGGIAEVRRLLATHGDLRLFGDGTLSLDAELQPEGAFTAEIAGFAAAVDALADAGAMGEDEARIAKSVLGFLSERPAPGRDRVIEVPLTLQDRVLSAGPVRLMRVPEVTW